ncbi:MAG: hypothetical protein AYK18_09565 [Theionarchaea archaeon DG-70]|nr:MAG: hypothetical protein AYK18_09565 [Theionarchaea archaeon DG-70]
MTKECHIKFWFFVSVLTKDEKYYFDLEDLSTFLKMETDSGKKKQLLLFSNSKGKSISVGKENIRENVADLVIEYSDLGILHRIGGKEKFMIRWRNIPKGFLDSIDDSKDRWENILGLYFKHEPAFRRVLALLFDLPPKKSISIKHLKRIASISEPAADHITRLLTYAGILETLHDGVGGNSSSRRLMINSERMNHFKETLKSQFLRNSKIDFFPEIFLMNLWEEYEKLQSSQNGGKIPIPSIKRVVCDESKLEDEQFRRLLTICWQTYPEVLSLYRMTESVAKRFNKKPIYIWGTPYFFISMKKPFELSDYRIDIAQEKLTEYI